MTSQEKKAFLKQYGYLDREVERLIVERDKWWTRATHITPNYSGSGGGSSEHSAETILLKIAEIEQDIDRRIDELIEVRRGIVEAIRTVDNPEYRELLQMRYIDGYSFEKIAEELHVSMRHATRMHGFALENLS